MTLEQAIQTLQANAKLLHFEHPHLGIKEAIEVVIEALSRTSPPSNLGEAAEEYVDYNSRRWHEDGDVYYDHSKILEAFKTGAEWAMRQGETVFGIVTKVGDKLDAETTEYLIPEESEFESGDKVVIQIRKQ